MIHRQMYGMVPQVPFAKDPGCIVLLLKDFCERRLVLIETKVCTVPQGPIDADAHVVCPGQESCSRGRANRRRYIEIGKHATLGRQAINVGSLVTLGPKRTDVCISHVVDEDEDNVGKALCIYPSIPVSAAQR